MSNEDRERKKKVNITNWNYYYKRTNCLDPLINSVEKC